MINPNAFMTILQELGNSTLVSIAALKVNEQNTCIIPFPDGLRVQIELDKYEKNVLICTILGELEPNEYRKKIFREALKANGMPPPLNGTLAFSTKANQLVLFEPFYLQNLTGMQIADYLPAYLDKARLWRDALQGMNIPTITPQIQEKNIFGLKL